MKQGIVKLMGLVRRLHRSEQGAEGLEKLLIIAAVVLPLLGLLIWYRGDIGKWVSGKYNEVANEDQVPINTPNPH